VRWLLEKGTIVIAAGGGGIPTAYAGDRRLHGIECVIDKDLCSALLARELGADVLVLATDADAVYLDWGKPAQRAIRSATPDAMDQFGFPAGSMGPKVAAAQQFARATGEQAIICDLTGLTAALEGRRGTRIANGAGPLAFHS